MSNNIIFVRINNKERKYKKNLTNIHYAPLLPFGIMATSLENIFSKCILLDSFYEKNIYQAIHFQLKKSNTLVLDIAYSEIEQTNKWLLGNHNKITTIFIVGKTATIYPNNFILPINTYLIKGEYENILPELLAKHNLPGNKIIEGKTIDLKYINAINYNFFEKYPYNYIYPIKVRGLKKYGFIEATRGCKGKCNFCDLGNRRSLYKEYREKNIDTIINEMLRLKKLGKTAISIEDDNLLQNKDFIINLTKQIIIKKVNIPYLLQCRAEMIDDEILYWLKKSLCSTICIGFESGSQKVLDYLGKGIKVNQMKSIVKKIHKYKMWVVGYFIIGLPKETVNDLKKTTQLIPKLNLDFIQLHYYFEKNPYYKFYPQQNTSPLIKKYYKKIILKYYLSPSFLIKYLHRLMFYDIFDIKSQTSLINIFFKMIVFNKI